MLAHYRPILDASPATTILLVTRNGIVATAAEALAAASARHITERQLIENLISSDTLLRDAESVFEADSLATYYQPATAYRISVKLAAENLESYFGQPVDALIERGLGEYSITEVQSLAQRLLGATHKGLSYQEALVAKRAVRERTTRVIAPLMQIVQKWLQLSDAPHVGLAILGSYGTGKSSFARALASACAHEYRSGDSDRIPILVELRNFGGHQSVEGLIADELANRHGVTDASFETFQRLNASGNLLLILDGFDEMKEGMSRDALIYNFNELGRLLVGDAKVLLCGRPTIFEGQDEQREVLTGQHGDLIQHSAKYIPVEIAPMSVEAVKATIAGFVEAHRADLGAQIDMRVVELQRALDHETSLRELLSRPVHVPMILRILPRWQRPLSELSRMELYKNFIDETIRRETKPGKLLSIGSEQRRRFAGELAVAMLSQGESRAIRQSMIPDSLIEPHRRPNESLDATRRDLVKACFLERKPPDILFFPHKSFAEYLVAERIVSVAESRAPATDRFDLKITPEILSFADEMLTPVHWANLLGRLDENKKVVRSFFKDLTDGPRPGSLGSLDGGGFKSLRLALQQDKTFVPMLRGTMLSHMPEMLLHYIAAGVERSLRDGERVAPAADEVLRTIAWHAGDIAAVHAYRALVRSNVRLAIEFAELQSQRMTSWKERGWLSTSCESSVAIDLERPGEVIEVAFDDDARLLGTGPVDPGLSAGE